MVPLEPNEDEKKKEYTFLAEEWIGLEQEVLFIARPKRAWKKLSLAEQLAMHEADEGPSRPKKKPRGGEKQVPKEKGSKLPKKTIANTRKRPRERLIETAKQWQVDGHVLMICNVGLSHWVTIRILLKEWAVELYDSMCWKYDTEAGVSKQHRVHQLKPVTRLLPRLLDLAGYWDKNRKSKQQLYEMELRVMPDSMQICQTDSVSCGVYCCMYIDRLLSNSSRHPSVDEKYLKAYRLKLASRIYSLSMNE